VHSPAKEEKKFILFPGFPTWLCSCFSHSLRLILHILTNKALRLRQGSLKEDPGETKKMKKTKGFTDFGDDFTMSWEIAGNKIVCRSKNNRPLVIQFSGDKIIGLKQIDSSSKKGKAKH